MVNDMLTDGSNENGKTYSIIENPSILYVEDDEANRLFMRLMAKGLCQIDIVNNGEQAIEKVQTKSYDGIFMDINLGIGIDGIETAKTIRTITGYENTPIAAVTAYSTTADRNKFLNEGCTHYLAKPFMKKDISELLIQFFN
jgi:FOG: CheY-like receiver